LVCDQETTHGNVLLKRGILRKKTRDGGPIGAKATREEQGLLGHGDFQENQNERREV